MASSAAERALSLWPDDAQPGSAAAGQPQRAEDIGGDGGWDGWGVIEIPKTGVENCAAAQETL
jgi:hypothetical protein